MSHTTTKAQSSKNPYWVKASWIMDVTGWDKEKMRRAREQKIVLTKGDKCNGILYDLNSIHPLLIKKAGELTTQPA